MLGGTTGETASNTNWFPSSSSSSSRGNNNTGNNNNNTSALSVAPITMAAPTLLPSHRQQQQDRMSPNRLTQKSPSFQKSPSPVSDVPVSSSSSSGSRRTRSPFLDHFRRRSKSDSKSSSSADFTSHSKLTHRRGSSILSVIQKHIPSWSDRRSCSVDASGDSHSASSSTVFKERDDRQRLMINPAIASHLSHQHRLDPYYTYTYGQDPRSIQGRRTRSGSGPRSIMDIFKRQDSSHHGSSTNISLHTQSSNKRSFDFGDLGKCFTLLVSYLLF